MLKEENTYLKGLIKAILVILFYLIATSCPIEFAHLIDINIYKLSNILKSIYLILYESAVLAIVIYAYKTELIQCFKNFSIKEFFDKYFKYWFLILVLMIISNSIVINFTTTDTSNNQEIIMEGLKVLPLYILFSTIIFAPLMEEIIFRFCIKKIIPKPSIIYILVSGLLFGTMHVILSMTSITDLLFIIPYSIPGIVFAYLYNKTGNIFIPAGIHFIHNGVLMILQLILNLI